MKAYNTKLVLLNENPPFRSLIKRIKHVRVSRRIFTRYVDYTCIKNLIEFFRIRLTKIIGPRVVHHPSNGPRPARKEKRKKKIISGLYSSLEVTAVPPVTPHPSTVVVLDRDDGRAKTCGRENRSRCRAGTWDFDPPWGGGLSERRRRKRAVFIFARLPHLPRADTTTITPNALLFRTRNVVSSVQGRTANDKPNESVLYIVLFFFLYIFFSPFSVVCFLFFFSLSYTLFSCSRNVSTHYIVTRTNERSRTRQHCANALLTPSFRCFCFHVSSFSRAACSLTTR